MEVLEEALRLHAAGFSVVPIKLDGSKAPALKEWRPLKDPTNPVRIEEPGLRIAFAHDLGLAVIAGQFSGGLECLDFDDHSGKPEADVFDQFWAVVKNNIPDLAPRLVVYQTPKNGWRVCYRCSVIHDKKSTPLARLSPGETIIEVLAAGAIVLVPGGHPAAHKTGKPYSYRQGRLAEVQTITEEERRRLHNAARVFDVWIPPEKKAKWDAAACLEEKRKGRRGPKCVISPGDDFNRRGTWEEVLGPLGWEYAHGGGAASYWTRPGKDAGVSASTDYHDGFMFVFTATAHPLEKDTAYSKFSAFALLHHGGDFRAAAADLTERGFGGVVLTGAEKERLALFSTFRLGANR